MRHICFLLVTIMLLISNCARAESLRFVQITDPHLFEPDNKNRETRNSLMYFYLAIEQVNKINQNLKHNNENILDFILLSGDLGIEKLLDLVPSSGKEGALTFAKEGKVFDIVKNEKKWDKALSDLANVLQDSDVKTWLLVPGNNDIYEDMPETIKFYQDFLAELKQCEQIKKSKIQIVDFRLESSDTTLSNLKPGIYEKGNLLILGFDNSFFKNQGSLKAFLTNDNKPKNEKDTTAYKYVQKLSDTLNSSKQKYAYIFMHIPEVDDPWLAKFDVNDIDEKNPVYKRMKKVRAESLELAETLNPYSSWTVPGYIRKKWEDLVTSKNLAGPEVKGIFTGHFHDKAQNTYLGFHWLKSHDYIPEILNKLYISPAVSIKNQLAYLSDEDCSRGMQYVTIDGDNGAVKRKIIWLYPESS